MSAWTEKIVALVVEGAVKEGEAAALLDCEPAERAPTIARAFREGWIDQELFGELTAALRADIVATDQGRTTCICCETIDGPPLRVVDARSRLHIPGCWNIRAPVVRLDAPSGWQWCDHVDCIRFVQRGASCYAGIDGRIHTDGGCGVARAMR